MRGKFIKKIERPKGYVNIDEVYEMLDGVYKEGDCELGDYGEVLSDWLTCDYDEVLDAISCCDVVKAIPLDRIKKAREEMNTLPKDYEYALGVNACLEILDRLIESEEK